MGDIFEGCVATRMDFKSFLFILSGLDEKVVQEKQEVKHFIQIFTSPKSLRSRLSSRGVELGA
jgi:hypothetical protein